MNYSNLKTNIKTKPITIKFNDNTIEIKKYIPIEDEINLIETVLNESMTTQHYYNPLTLKMLFSLHILYNFTNIEFSEEDKANPTKLYDEVRATGLLQAVLNEILEEVDILYEDLMETVDSVYSYLNSVYGTIENMQNNVDDLGFDIQKMINDVKDPEQLAFLKEVLNKMG